VVGSTVISLARPRRILVLVLLTPGIVARVIRLIARPPVHLCIVLPERLHYLVRHTVAHAQRHDAQDEHAIERQIVVYERVQVALDRVF